jgi:hypothetical protein
MVCASGFGINFDAGWEFRRSILGGGAYLACITYSLLLRLRGEGGRGESV